MKNLRGSRLILSLPLFILKKETSACPESLCFQLTYVSFARAHFHRFPISRELCLSLGNVSCNQRCIHPCTSASSRAGARVPRGLMGAQARCPGRILPYTNQIALWLPFVKMAGAQALLLRLLGDMKRAQGNGWISPSVHHILLRTTTCWELQTLRSQLFGDFLSLPGKDPTS